MNHANHNKLIAFIWSIADDCLRDIYVRGKYRDVILPMVVLRRLDALLETTKDAVMEEVRFQREEMHLAHFESNGLRDASGFVFYNTSPWTLQKLYDTATNSQQLLVANFNEYLDGFSHNVQEILTKFQLRLRINELAEKDALLNVLDKFTSPDVNLTPHPKLDSAGRKLPALTNLGMGYVFEELIRKFNEENNEEAGEHYTPREVIELMTHLVFLPVKDKIPPVLTIYDPACGTGGMLTEAENFITNPEGEIKATNSDVFLFGKEISNETYAICKSDMMIKGKDPENIKVGSTLSTDEFAGTYFDFMLTNPPYGKSWSSEVKHIKDGKDVIDPRFRITLNNYWQQPEEVDATPRTSDGQMLFLMEMVSKMKALSLSPLGSRIASVHNGSSLFTGAAGGGESNIRRYIIESDYVEAIIQLPNNMFYNTGITTYIWLLTNNKAPARRGKIQLIDANGLYRKLRKNLGDKNCELSPQHIQQILHCYTHMQEHEKTADDPLGAKIFNNNEFGYNSVNIEQPRRLSCQFTSQAIETLRYDKANPAFSQYLYQQYGLEVFQGLASHTKAIEDYIERHELNINAKQLNTYLKKETWLKQDMLYQTALRLQQLIGTGIFTNANNFYVQVDDALRQEKIKLSASEKKQITDAVSQYSPTADKVIKKTEILTGTKLQQLLAYLGCQQADLPLYGYYPTATAGEYIVYETDSELRDTENVPLDDSIQAYFIREVQPYSPESWINMATVKTGYEISFNKYFYKPEPLRTVADINADITALEHESDGLMAQILNF